MIAQDVFVSVEQASSLIDELSAGNQPDILHALRVAGISPRMNLSSNNGYAVALRSLRGRPLPDRDQLLSLLSSAKRMDGTGRPAWGLMSMHVDTLYALDAFWFGNPGCQGYIANIGETLQEQRAWRCWMNSHVWGMGFKCLSWAAFIYSPQTCQLLTLDSWHAKRLGVNPTLLARDSELSHELYRVLEDQVIAEVNAKYPGYPSTVGAACEWFNVRRSGYETHAGLNCRLEAKDE